MKTDPARAATLVGMSIPAARLNLRDFCRKPSAVLSIIVYALLKQ
ncbi:hypothetical protein [Acerihabitans sp.]